MKKKKIKNIAIIFFLLLLAIAFIFIDRYNLISVKSYSAEDFGIEWKPSDSDFNKNGLDDYLDILEAARRDALNKVKYDGRYFDGGYPPDDIGVCTDLIWRAFKNANLSLRDMLDQDIKENPQDYPEIIRRDPNIDFRRVKNLKVFFDKYGDIKTTNIDKIGEFQAGDILIFDGDKHIGIVSDKRNKKGFPYIIHNSGQPRREENLFKRRKPTSHYRINFERLKENDLLIPFE